MSPTSAQNAKDIKELREDYTDFKEDHIKSTAQVTTTLTMINDTLKEVRSDQKDMAQTLNNLAPVVHSISTEKIPKIEQEQEKNKKFRWRSVGVAGILTIIFIALVTAGFAWGFRQIGDNETNGKDIKELKTLIQETNGTKTNSVKHNNKKNKDSDEEKNGAAKKDVVQ